MGDSSQGGGSTITQQLAKTLYPRQDVSSRIPGGKFIKLVTIKIKEWITAVKLERNYTKNEIVTMYLNAIFFGSNAYGVKSAAATFFDKDVSDLTIEESACLVGMVNKPTRYNPAINPENSLKRRNHVLRQMEKYDYISSAQYDSIVQIPIVLSYRQQDHLSLIHICIGVKSLRKRDKCRTYPDVGSETADSSRDSFSFMFSDSTRKFEELERIFESYFFYQLALFEAYKLFVGVFVTASLYQRTETSHTGDYRFSGGGVGAEVFFHIGVCSILKMCIRDRSIATVPVFCSVISCPPEV